MEHGVVVYDTAFAAAVGRSSRLSKLVDTDAHEGPVYLATTNSLFATSLPRPGRPSTILRIDLDDNVLSPARSVVRLDTGAVMPNGMAADYSPEVRSLDVRSLDVRDTTLIVCEQGDLTHDACISRIHPSTLERTVIVDRWRGLPLNSPNDVATAAAVLAQPGAIWFTDPAYGHLQGFRPPPELGDYVYRWDARSGRVDVVADGFDKPNGIALSPDGATLYVTDSGADRGTGTFEVHRPRHVIAFDVVDDVTGGQRLTGRRLVAVTAPGTPDGLKVDADGRLYVSSTAGVLVYSPDGALLGEIAVPGTVNFAFGGRDNNVLFITADTALWAVELTTTGPLPRSTRMTGASR